MEPQFVFFPWKRPDGDVDVADLEHMIHYGVEELLDLGERGLYFDPVLHAKEIRGPRGRAPAPDVDAIRFHVTGSMTLDDDGDAVRLRVSVRDTQGDVSTSPRRITIRRDDGDDGPFPLDKIHAIHRRLYEWFIEVAALDMPEPRSYHAYRLETPVTPSLDSFRELVRGLRRAGEIDEKIPHYRRAVEIDPCLGRGHRNLGYLLRARGDLEAAIECYERAASTMIDRCGLGEVYFEMGLSYAGLQTYRDAIRCWRRSLEFSPDRREALYNIGLAYEEMGKNEDALDYYARARDNDPSYLSALEGLFRLYIQESQYLKAVEVLKDWISITPHDAGLHRIIGHCYRKEGMNDEALHHLKKAVELDPEGEIGREARRDILDL